MLLRQINILRFCRERSALAQKSAPKWDMEFSVPKNLRLFIRETLEILFSISHQHNVFRVNFFLSTREIAPYYLPDYSSELLSSDR